MKYIQGLCIPFLQLICKAKFIPKLKVVGFFLMKEKKREDNEGGNFQIRPYGKLDSRKWLHYRHLDMRINFTNIH